MLPHYSAKPVLTARARLGEGPVWDPQRQCLYWLDIYNHRVHRFDPETGADRHWPVGDVVGCLGLTEEHRLILAQCDRIAFLNLDDGTLSPILTLEADQPDNRFNDGKCDPQGRFWFGSMSDHDGQASLYRYDPDGSVHIMETGLTISNGLGWSPDGETFYLTDTPKQTIYAYDFAPTSGAISNRRPHITLTHESFYPDGLTVDQEGCLWVAMWDGGCVIRFDPQGQAIARVDLPVPRPTCCVFGGPDLQDLYITTASVALSQKQIQQFVTSGDLFCLKTEVAGLPCDRFQG